MKLLVFQGSPRPKGYTQMVLEKFLQGAASKGASSEVIRLAGKRIHPCIYRYDSCHGMGDRKRKDISQ
jgi:multimeric flavodoxin WrbA